MTGGETAMAVTRAVMLAIVLAWAMPARAQAPAADGVTTLLKRAETMLNAGDASSFPGLFSNVPQDQIDQ